jgi:hypothetical protein
MFGFGIVRVECAMVRPKARWQKTQSNAGRYAEAANPERRVAPRLPVCQAVTVRFDASGQYEFTGVSRDMSSSGIFLFIDSQIEEGSLIELLLTLPSETSQPIPMRVRGRVVRVEKASPSGIAIAFDSLVIAPEF